MSGPPLLQADRSCAGWLTFERLAALLLFATIGFVACLMPAQNDTWWHLRAGQETWLAGGVQLRDSFSHTVNGAYWPNLEWLSEVLFYGFYRAGGLPLLTAFVAALVALSWAVVWRLTPGPILWRVGLCAAAIVSSAPEWSLRPKVFTLFFVALTTLLLSRRRYLWLPPLFVVWANLHGGVMLGIVMVMTAAAVAAIAERRVWTRAALASAGCVLATAFTPLGLSLWTEIPESILRIRQYDIQEWRPPGFTDPFFAPFWIIAGALVGLTALRQPWRSRSAHESVTLWIALAMLPLAFSASRNVSAVLLVAVPAVAALLQPGAAPVVAPFAARQRPWANAAILGMALLAAPAWIAHAWAYEIPRLAWHPVPQPALDAVLSCPGRLYNRYDDGGYLIWFAPTRKVFIDSRQDPYPAEMMHEHMRVEQSGDYEPVFREYSIGCAFLPTEAPVAERLRMAKWTALYEGPTWTVLARPEGSAAIATGTGTNAP